MMKNLFKTVCLLAAWASVATGALAASYDNAGKTLTRKSGWNTATEGMDYYPTSSDGKTGYVVSLQNYGYVNVYKYNGSTLSGAKHFQLASFRKAGGSTDATNYQNHGNLVSFGSKKFASGDVLPVAYISRCNTGNTDKWGVKRACYVERIDYKNSKSTLVQVIGVDNFVKGNPQFMVDGSYLYLFGNTVGNGKAGNKHYVYKLKLPALPKSAKAPQVKQLTAADEVYHYTWESTYAGGANPTIQGGCVKNGLMYLPMGRGTAADPSIIYVWNLDKRQMETEINLQGTATKAGTVKFKGELEDVSLAYKGRLLVQAHIAGQSGKLYWISTSYLPKLRQNDWRANATPQAQTGCAAVKEGYYYLQVKHNTSAKPNWLCVQTLKAKNRDQAVSGSSSTAVDSRVKSAVGQPTLQVYTANKVYQNVPKSGHDASFIFHVTPTSATASTYTIANCGVTGKPYLQQYLQKDDWTIINAVATKPTAASWSQFQFAPGNYANSFFIKARGTGSGAKTRMWRRGGAANGITTSALRDYNDNVNDFVWVPITDAQVLAYAKYCEQVSICLGLPKGSGAGQVRSAKYSQFQSWLKALNVDYSASADYSALLKQVTAKKQWATSNAASAPAHKPAATLGDVLSGTDGTAYAVRGDLYCAYYDQQRQQAFVTDGQGRWIALTGVQASQPAYAGVAGTLRHRDGNPELALNAQPVQGQGAFTALRRADLLQPATLQPQEVVRVSGIVRDGQLWAGGQPVALDLSSLPAGTQLAAGETCQLVAIAQRIQSGGMVLRPVSVTSQSGQSTPTAVTRVETQKAVASVTYYNVQGQASATPFTGVNIVVTRYTDGTQHSIKQIIK